MLDELSKKDKKWRQLALSITKDKDEADEIVQEMYLRFYRNPKEEVTDQYVYFTLLSVYLNEKKKIKIEIPVDVFFEQYCDNDFEPDDYQREILEKASELNWYELELLEENYHNSLREIADNMLLPVSYGFIYRSIMKARENILGDDIHKYNNKRLKHNNNGKKKED